VRVKVPFLGRTWLAPCWPAGPASRPGSRSTARPMTTGSASRSWPPAPPPRPWRGAARTCSGSALVFEAMALHHLGQPGKARAALERADEMYRDLLASLADSPEGPLGRDWVDVLIFQIAREEAGRVMKLPVPDPR